LAKPVDPSELASRVQNALAVKAYQDHLSHYAETLELRVKRRTEELLASRREAQHRYVAGKAEIASEVLHNVGNALHSVNVSTNLIRQTLLDSRLPFLRKTAELIDEHSDRLGAFLQSDRRGKLIPDYLRELSEDLDTERKTVLDEVERLIRHLNHIHTIVAAQQRHVDVAPVIEPVAIADLLADAEVMSGLASDASIEVRHKYEDLPIINTDKHKLMQVLVNIFKNARESLNQSYQHVDGGAVEVRTEKSENNRVRIIVADNGVGIADENLSQLFSFGFSTKESGQGIGLHSCANIVKELGGSIQAHSNVGGLGATFTIELPITSTVG
jgi:signal transduction histidine kinase